jgi:prevent-host-death family protein
MSVLTKPTDRISATEARVHFGEIYRRVTENDETIIVERNGKPGAVLISFDLYEALSKGTEIGGWWDAILQSQAAFRPFLEQNPDFDAVEIIREMRDERDEQITNAVLGR